MQDHRNLRVWRRSHGLTLFVLAALAKPRFRRPDTVWLTNQMRRAAASVGANIAEGAAQETSAQFARFLVIAAASLNELLNHTDVARDMGLLSAEECARIVADAEAIRAMLVVLLRRVREREAHATQR